MSITWGSMRKGTMTKKTKIIVTLSVIGAFGLIVVLKYLSGKKSSSGSLPVNSRTAGSGSLGSDVPIATPQAITEAAFNQSPSVIDDPIDDPSSEDTGVLSLQ